MRVFRTTAIVAFGLLVAAGAATAENVTAITTGGQGNLTMCPYMGYMGCNLYHHIKLPPQIAVGDSVRVRFGSNPKEYNFPVARIVRDGAVCTVYSQTETTEDVEKIAVTSCDRAAQ